MSEQRTTYCFGPLERRGLLGALAGGQVASLVAGVLIAVLALDRAPSLGGLMVAIIALGIAGAVAFAPLGGRTPQEWLPIAVAFAARRGEGRHRFASPAPTAGTVLAGPGADRSAVPGRTPEEPHAPERPRRGRLRDRRPSGPIAPGPPPSRGAADEAGVPPQLRGVRLASVDAGGRAIGALSERHGRRLTAVLACRVAAFSLLDPEAQERRLARWGLALSGAAAGPVRRLQWIERTAPAQGDELARWVHAERDPAVPLRGTPMLESYLELISSSTRVTQEHEVLVAVQVDAGRVRERGRDAVPRALADEVQRLAQSLEAAEITVLGALHPGQLARVVRTAYDPYVRAELTTLHAVDPERDGIAEPDAFPLGACESWDQYACDGAVHATFWISAWPRVEVSPMFMDALLGHSRTVRTVSVSFEPLAADRSTREVEAAVTRDRADRDLRSRFGQSETARQRQAAAATMRREAELAAGHGEVRLSGFVTVSGRDRDELRAACAEVLEHAARARLELRRLYGQQAEAFTFTLPLCRGLR